MRQSTLRIWALASLITTGPTAVYANTVRWTSVEVTPNAHVLKCKRSDRLQDTQTRAGIARGLAGNVEEVGRKISAMRSVEYQASGPAGNETYALDFKYTGEFQQPMKFSARAMNNEIHFYARAQAGGSGRIVAKDRDKVRQVLTPENRSRVTNTYQAWQSEFKNEVGRIQQKFGDYVIPLSESERPDLSRAMRGAVKKRVLIEMCNNDYPVYIRAEWQRQVNAPLGTGR